MAGRETEDASGLLYGTATAGDVELEGATIAALVLDEGVPGRLYGIAAAGELEGKKSAEESELGGAGAVVASVAAPVLDEGVPGLLYSAGGAGRVELEEAKIAAPVLDEVIA